MNVPHSGVVVSKSCRAAFVRQEEFYSWVRLVRARRSSSWCPIQR